MPKAKKVQIKILKPVAGQFALSAKVGSKVSYPEKQASEIVDAGYAEYVGKKENEEEK